MTVGNPEARKAYERLVGALETHLAAVEQRSGEHDPAVQAAYLDLRAAAADYDDALYSAHDEITPFDLPPLPEDDEDEEEDDDPTRVSVLARWDYSVVDPDLLFERAAATLGEDVDSNAVAVGALAHLRGHTGLGNVDRAASVGLRWHGVTTWVVASDEEEDSDGNGWMDDAFGHAEPDAVLCRFDVPVRGKPDR